MRRPGFLGSTNYWFGNVNMPTKQLGMVAQKLEEVRLAKIQNGTPLSMAQRTQRIQDHLKNPRKLSQQT